MTIQNNPSGEEFFVGASHFDKLRTGLLAKAHRQQAGSYRGRHLERMRGFTLVEMIVIMVIIGILAVAALPRFFDRNTFDSRGFYDQAISTLRYAQKTAVAQHRFVCVAFTTNREIKLTYDTTPPSPAHTTATCPGSDLSSPTGESPFTVTSPTVDVTLSGYADFYFDALGRASAAQDITVSGYTTHILVEAETGYVH